MTYQEADPTIRFGDMVHNINERILPEDAEGLPYVGLEHLDPESLKIRRWGTPDEVEAQKLRFYAGDIIFGKRRFYQKKLAVADFEGICSAHAMVLRAKPNVVLPEFLPFFMQSEMFFERAMAISVGSLSPTINWSTLARQEFPLPPLDEQFRMAEILWAVEENIEQYNQVTGALEQTLIAYQNEFFIKKPDRDIHDWKALPLAQICDSLITYGIVQAGPHVENGVPYIRVTDMTKGHLTTEGMLRTSRKIATEYERSRVETNDIVFALRGQLGLVLKIPEELDGANLTQGEAGFEPK